MTKRLNLKGKYKHNMKYFNAIAFTRSTGQGNLSQDKFLSQTFSPTTIVFKYPKKKSTKELNFNIFIKGIIHLYEKLFNKKIHLYIKVSVSLVANWHSYCHS